MHLYTALVLFLSKALGKNHIACYLVLHGAVLHYCRGVMVTDAVSLGMLCLVVFKEFQIQPFWSPITLIAFHCPSLLICLTQ